jgi:hypothetical protein
MEDNKSSTDPPSVIVAPTGPLLPRICPGTVRRFNRFYLESAEILSIF